MAASNRCAACKCLRRRCPEDCVLAPYFPSTHPQRFACVHKIYGASNVTKMLQLVPVHLRAQAANSLSFEAHLRVEDPVYGCVGIIHQLQHEIYMTQYELAKIQAHLALYDCQILAPSQARLQQNSRYGICSNWSEHTAAQSHQVKIASLEDRFPLSERAQTQAQHEMGKSQVQIAWCGAEPSLAEASCSDTDQHDSLHRLDQLLLNSNHH